MSLNVRKQRTYDDFGLQLPQQTLDISALSFTELQVAKKARCTQ